MRKRTAGLLLSTALCLSWAGPAAAQDTQDRIDALERQLRNALGQIQELSQELEELKAEDAGKTADTAPPPAATESTVIDSLAELDERVTDVEDVVTDIDQRVGSRAVVNAFDAVELDFGGFVDTALTHIRGEDGAETAVNRTVFELLLSAKLDEDWELFVAQAFVRNTAADLSDPLNPSFADINSPVATDTVLAWVNYQADNLFNVRAGRFITPHGIINIEHFPALLLDPEQPQFLRPFPGQTLFPNFSNGLQVHGTAFLGERYQDSFEYSVYAASFAGNSSDFNYGGRAAYGFGDWGVKIGANTAYGQRTDQVDSGYFLYGADLLFDKGPFLWKNEIFFSNEDLGENRFAYYTQPAYRLTDRWTAFYRYDFLDGGTNPNTLAEIGESTEHAFGLSFKPVPNVHLRTIFTLRQLEATAQRVEADLEQLQFAATLNF